MSDNVVSVRLPFECREKMLLDCAQQKKNPTEWMLQKIAVANRKDDAKKNIVRMLAHLRRRTRFENNELYNNVIELSNYVEEHL